MSEMIEVIENNGILQMSKEEYASYLVSKYVKNCKIYFKDNFDRLGRSTVFSSGGRITGRYIVFNKKVLELFNMREYKQLILHEIAHQLTPYHDHDKVYRKKAIEIGVDEGSTGKKFMSAPFWKVAKAIGWNRTRKTSKRNVKVNKNGNLNDWIGE